MAAEAVAARPLLRDRPLVALLAAEVVSTTGSQMTWLALPWFVLITSGSATRTTFVVAAELVGLAVLGLPGGRALQRFGARRTMLLCDGARAPLMAVIPVLHFVDALAFAPLLVVAFLLGCLTAPYFAAQRLIVPELLGEDEELLSKANALFQAATRTTILLGPVVGGVLIGVIGAANVLLVDAASYVVAVTIVAAFVPRRPPVGADGEERGVRTGLRFLVRDRLLRVWWPAFALGDAAWTAFFVTVPVLVVSRFGADATIAGWLIASFGIGAVAGNAVAYRFLIKRVDGLTLIGACIMGQALPLWFLPLSLPAWCLSAAIVASGIANGLVNPSLHAISILRVPVHLRATVMTTAMVVWALVNPLGLFAAGPILDAFGTTPVLVGFAAVQTTMMATAGLAAIRTRRRERGSPTTEPLPAGSPSR
jgi:MFS family permease